MLYLTVIASFILLSSESVLSTHIYNQNNGVIRLPILPHDHVLERRRRERGLSSSTNESKQNKKNTNTQIGSLYQGYGAHYVDLWVGTPVPQRQTVIVDTGSQVTAFPCIDCDDCGESHHTDPSFDYEKSDSFRRFKCDECILGYCAKNSTEGCRLGVMYEEGSSWRAYESSDIVYAGGLHNEATLNTSADPAMHNDTLNGLTGGELPKYASDFGFSLYFGCQNNITGFFQTQLADGIMGMSNQNASFWKQMYDQDKIKEKSFSLCFRREQDSKKVGTAAGAMTLGGVEEELHETTMVFAKNQQTEGYFTVELRSIYLRTHGGIQPLDDNGELVELNANENLLNHGRSIVDSGTTCTYLNKDIMLPFLIAWKKITGFTYRTDGFRLTDGQLEQLPTILLQLEGDDDGNQDIINRLNVRPSDIPGLAASIDPDHPLDVVVAISPVNYIEYNPDTELYSSRIFLDEDSGSIIGANTMYGHDVMFDVENQRIGWAESHCKYQSAFDDDDEEDEEEKRF